MVEGAGRAAHRGGSEGEALRIRDGAPPDRRGDPDPRRLRLHEGVPGRALLPRREDHGDLRGDERDPAARDRALRARPPAARRAVSPRDRDEPVTLSRIYTRTGDGGETHLGDLSRVSKLDERIAAFGTVDELNSWLGLALAEGLPEELREPVTRIQNELFDLGADLSVPVAAEGRLRVTGGQVERLERLCDEFNA